MVEHWDERSENCQGLDGIPHHLRCKRWENWIVLVGDSRSRFFFVVGKICMDHTRRA